MQICGWENYATEDFRVQLQLVHRQIGLIRARWPNIVIMIGCESNNNMALGLLQDYIAALPEHLRRDVYMVYDSKPDNAPPWLEPRLGIRTTNASKHSMTLLVRSLLGSIMKLEPNQLLMLPIVQYDAQLNPAPVTDAEKAGAAQQEVDEFKRQLVMFEKITTRSATSEIAKFTYNGKKNGQMDDLVCALLMLGRAFQYIFTSQTAECIHARALALSS